MRTKLTMGFVPLQTIRNFTNERFLSSVGPYVGGEVRGSPRPFPAEATHEFFLARVGHVMSFQAATARERFRTLSASVRSLPSVRPSVEDKLSGGCASVTTFAANERFLPRVRSHVDF